MPNNIVVPDLTGGVSQLPEDQREANQLEQLDNGYPSRKFGLIKRPPATQVCQLHANQTNWDNAFIYFFDRTPDERYVVCIDPVTPDLKVFDVDTGVEQTVLFPDGKGYLSNTTDSFRAFTVGDHTYIVNRDMTVKRGSTRTAVATNEALVFVRMAAGNNKCGFAIDRFYTEYATADHGFTTETVANGLYNKLVNDTDNSGFTDQFTITLMGSTIYIVRKDGQPFKIEHFDGLADKGLRIIQGQVQAQEDLPERALDGMVLEITGDPKDATDSYWARFDADGGADKRGVWVQCPEPGVVVDYDYTTTPHELVRQGAIGPQFKTHDLYWQPTYAPISGTSTGYGWSKDGSDVALTGTTAQTQVITAYGGAVRTAGVTGDPSLPLEVTFGFDVDTGTANAGAPIDVVFSANTGAAWAEIGRRHYDAGQKLTNQTWSLTGVYPTGTKFELRMDYGAIAILPSVTFPLSSRTSRVMAHGSGDNIPGVTITSAAGYRFSLGKENANVIWPMGAVVTVHIGGATFTYTLPDDKTGQQLCTAIAAVIDADPQYVSAYEGPSFYTSTGIGSKATGLGTLVNNVWGKGIFQVAAPGWVVSRADGTVPAISGVSATITLDDTVYTWDPNATLVASAQVGRTLHNVTDGSTGTIVANSKTCIQVGSLTGGVYNVFSQKDIIQIENAATEFVFQAVPWTIRTCGNDDTSKNPFPSFVGRKISEVFFSGNRLGFLAENYVSMSCAGDLLNFWRTTVTELLDSDRIDVAGAHKDVAFLDSAVDWEGKLMLCSPAGHQFALTGEPSLTPSTVRMEHLSSYPQTKKVRPIALGHSVFFTREADGYTQLRELFVTRDGIQAESCSDHVPRYVPGDVLSITGDPDLGFLAVVPNGGTQSDVYVYCFSPLGDQSRQKAWAKWTFPSRVLGVHMSNGILYVARYRGTAVYLDSLAVSNPPAATATTYQDPGATNYTLTARLSRLFLRDRNGNPINSGRTQIHTVRPVLDSGYLKVTVTPDNRDAKNYAISSRKPRAAVLAENKVVTIDLINDGTQAGGATGASITGLEFEASFNNRSR